MSLRRRLLAVALLAAVAAVSSALAGSPAFSAKLGGSDSSYVGYPNSIAVLAHSGATGENSDPRRPGVEVRANSWATGTNPAVKSVYLRILAKNPAIKGHNVNLARGSASVHDLVRQAQRAVALEPKPDLILIQIMDSRHRLPGESVATIRRSARPSSPRSSCLPKARPSRASSSSASSGVMPRAP